VDGKRNETEEIVRSRSRGRNEAFGEEEGGGRGLGGGGRSIRTGENGGCADMREIREVETKRGK